MLIYILLSLIISGDCNQDGVWSKCKPRPGCNIGKCDPIPFGRFEAGEFSWKDNEFPILCQHPETMSSGCPQNKFDFPTMGQVTNMIRLKVPVPRITEITVCTRITVRSAGFEPGAILSYATTTTDNAFLLEATHTGIGIWINGVQKIIAIDMTAKIHLCVVAAPTQGWIKTYRNGNLFARTLHPGRTAIDGGGSLLIGQEQDAFMDLMDRNQAFSGILENLMLWYRVLEPYEVTKLYRDRCSCPERPDVAFTPDQIQIAGKVASLPVNQC